MTPPTKRTATATTSTPTRTRTNKLVHVPNPGGALREGTFAGGRITAAAVASVSALDRPALAPVRRARVLLILLALLIGAGLLAQSLLRLQHVSLGFQPDRLLTFQLSLPRTKYPDDKSGAFYRTLLESLRATPGVLEVTEDAALNVAPREESARNVRGGDVAGFVAWLRLPPEARGGKVAVLPTAGHHCSAVSVNRKLAALISFCEFHARHGVDLARLLVIMQPAGRHTAS